MSQVVWPWERYGGSFIWRPGRAASLPGRCCEAMAPYKKGDCRDGCCEDYVCLNCHKAWRYEFPD